MSFNDLLNKIAIVYRKSSGSANSFGECSFSLDAIAGTVACALQPIREELSFHRGGSDYVVTNTVYCDIGVDITPGDYLEIEGLKFLVLAVMDDAGREHHYKCYVHRS